MERPRPPTSNARLRRVLPVVAVLIAVSGGLAAMPTAAVAAEDPVARVNSSFKRLVTDTRRLSRKAASRRVRASLLRTAKRARKSSRRRPCASVRQLRRYRRGLKKVSARQKRRRGGRPGPASPRGRLAADALAADAALKQLPRTRRCGGGAEPTGATLETSVTESNSQLMKMQVSLPTARWGARRGGGKDFVDLSMDGADALGDPGDPGVPAFTRFFAVPRGADVSVEVSNVTGYTLTGVDLFPKQEQPVDQDEPSDLPPPSFFADKPFEIDRGAYRSRAELPARLDEGTTLGTMRDLVVGGVQIAGAQYRPRQRRLRVLTGMEVTVRFGANGGTWRSNRVRTPFEAAFERIYRAGLENYGAVSGGAGFSQAGGEQAPDETALPGCGEDFLIVTSAALRPAADTLAASKQAAGYVTAIHEVAPGTAATDVRDFIRGELNDASCARPAFVVLLGDTSHVPTFLEAWCADPPTCTVSTDLPYSLDGVSSDAFADTMLGRIPANTLATANTIVNKTIQYETVAPAPPGDDFYNHATVTTNFEGLGPRDQRGFTRSAETFTAGLRSRGHVVHRLFTAQAAANIQEFKDGQPFPPELKRPATPWTDGRDQLVAEFNAGRFLLLHRDHGSRLSWANPGMNVNDIGALNNSSTELPVAFAINCSSAGFQFPGNPSFVERLLSRAGGGAVAAIGDTDISPTVQNDQLTVGYGDAMFPDTVPAFGGSEPVRHLGEVLLAGKTYMAAQAPADQQLIGNVFREHLLWHLLGDPSLEMWTAEPQQFDLGQIKTQYVGRNVPPLEEGAFRVRVNGFTPAGEGALATLRRAGEAIGRARVVNGEALITPERRTDSTNLTVALEHDGFLAEELPVSANNPTHTIQCPAPTSNTQSATTSGRVTQGGGAIKDGLVRVRYTDPSGDVFMDSDLTDDNGEWSSTRTPPLERGTWTVEAFFEDKGVKDATCTFTVP